MSQEKTQQRIDRLLALAKSSTSESEAQAARKKAEQLMADNPPSIPKKRKTPMPSRAKSMKEVWGKSKQPWVWED